MRMRSTNALLLGIAIGAIAVGATTVVSANGGSAVTACANKTSGAMRYIAKGKCKKTEKLLSWNQMGPQGVSGAQGQPGPQGIPGPQGTTASNGYQATSVFDVSGTNIGRLVSVGGGTAWDDLIIAIGKYYYRLGSDGGAYDEVFFTGDNCTGTPFSSGMSWPRPLSQSELTVTYEAGTSRVRFFEHSSNAAVSLIMRSRLSDNTSQNEEPVHNGIGDCQNFTPSSPSNGRILREINPPVVIDTSGPLSLNTP
jgi:hypothetical protein